MEKRLDLRQWLFGLLIECPMRKELTDCPINKYRSILITKKLDFAYNLEEEELKDLLIHHKKCLSEREFEILKKQLTKSGYKKCVLF